MAPHETRLYSSQNGSIGKDTSFWPFALACWLRMDVLESIGCTEPKPVRTFVDSFQSRNGCALFNEESTGSGVLRLHRSS